MSEQVALAIDRLRVAGVTLKRGLNIQELSDIEDQFGFKFGPEHRELLTMALPSGDRWTNWRNASPDDLRARLTSGADAAGAEAIRATR